MSNFFQFTGSLNSTFGFKALKLLCKRKFAASCYFCSFVLLWTCGFTCTFVQEVVEKTPFVFRAFCC